MFLQPYYLNLANIFFLGLIVLLTTFTFFSMYLRAKQEGKHAKWKLISNLLIRKAIFFEEENENKSLVSIPITPRTTKLLKNPHFRKVIAQELLNAKKNLSGSSAGYIKRLYLQLNLDIYALNKLKSDKWYIKAQAIQELSIMDLKENLTKIYRLINNINDLVRMEAQVAVVRLYGFEALRFLDLVSYPLSEWQQIKLLQELSQVSAENFNGIEKWLKSENKTVVIFALKLARIYFRFELHDHIAKCLTDTDAQIRLQAILTLGEIYNDQTAGILIGKYLKEDLTNQMAIVQVLGNIATEEDYLFLLDQLNTDHAELKAAVARSLARQGPSGLESLEQHDHAKSYPLTEIIGQLKTELIL